MARAFLKVFFDFEERTEQLDGDEQGRLLLGMLHYARTGEEPELSGNERFLWPVFRKEIDAEIASYETRVANGSKGGRPARNAAKAETETTGAEPDETEQNRNKPNETENNRNAEEQEQEQDIYPTDDDDDIRARAREDEVAEAFRYGFGRAGTPEEISVICNMAKFSHFGDGVAGYAVELAAKHGARSPASYCQRVMGEWESAGLRTLDEIGEFQVQKDAKRGRAAFRVIEAIAGRRPAGVEA